MQKAQLRAGEPFVLGPYTLVLCRTGHHNHAGDKRPTALIAYSEPSAAGEALPAESKKTKGKRQKDEPQPEGLPTDLDGSDQES